MSPSSYSEAVAQPMLPQDHAEARSQPACTDCLGSGGWFRYEPALDPAPGLLYLSCVHCRGSGRTFLAQA